MPMVSFTPALRRFLAAPSAEVEAATVAAALDAVFAERPALRSYVLDDQGALRHHVAAFVDGVVVRDKQTLAETVPAGGEVYLVQALSGG